MQSQPQRDTAPELALRSALHKSGLRFRVDYKLPEMRRRADIAFPSARVAVFVDGCFWHGCPRHGTAPKANAAWWAEKIARNAERDRDTDARLRDAGWKSVRVWEHEPVDLAVTLVSRALQERSAARTKPWKQVPRELTNRGGAGKGPGRVS
jgi:DNA mismatch endonuclease (patch repair protein)